jgi:hypothetical protein
MIDESFKHLAGSGGKRSLGSAFQLIAILVLVCAMLMPAPKTTVQAWTIPTFDIVSVTPDTSVKVRTYNFPAGEIFTVRIGAYGTLAVGGTVVGTTNSGAGGSFEETYTIPAALAGSAKLAIRMDSANGYYSYNWFDNVSGGTTATAVPGSATATPVYGTGGPYTGYTGIPTFNTVSSVAGTSVTVQTNNFPPNQAFTVRIGAYGTLGIGGTVVATTNSGAGGSFTETYTIPSALAGNYQLAIRMESPAGYFAYNWFYNNTSGGTGGAYTATPSGSATAVPVYNGIPTFNVTSVITDSSVTIQTSSFPSNTDFTVRMGAYGTLGIGGTVVGTTSSGAGGSFSATYDIPASLKGSGRIAIRMESASGYYAYNWFYNSTSGGTGGAYTPTPGGSATATPVPSTPVYTGIPTFGISSVVRDSKVTISTNNFPAGVDFVVKMGAYGTMGVGGTEVGTTNSGSGGTISATYNIPDSLKGADRIAIRMESSSGYFAYNWFWNY